MADDATQLGLVVGISTAVNVAYASANGKDAIVPLVAGGVTYVGLSVFGGLTKYYSVAIAVAWVFLLSSLVMRGIPLIQKTSALATGAKSVGNTNRGPKSTGTLGGSVS